MTEHYKNLEGKDLEDKIFSDWKKGGFFSRSEGFGENKDKPFTIVIPPPNITGVLHMGHALNDSIQDALIRHARMCGFKTRWVLGTDHAGIATQTKVDKHLAAQGINRREIGREAFIDACYEWRVEYGTTIVKQIASMGCSCDYDNENFTMSEEFSRCVKTLFKKWYDEGIIYRGKRIVNWCPSCTTAIADDEAEYEDENSHLWYLKYPLKESVDGTDYVVVATTRPETMLGDSGVAVSPKDERYKNLVGKSVILPIVGREIPIFEDFYVDSEYGTGCVKTTPAHDINDYQMGVRHDLEVINIFDETAHVVEGFGKFSGMSRDEARSAIVEEFEKLGLLDHIEDLNHSVMHCYRCHSALEPYLSEQWFVDVDKIKGPAREAVESGKVKFYPERWKSVYLDWLENLKDWCISRQLWWGHQIPVYYCDGCSWSGASIEGIDKCPECGAALRQDEDVLDTWFSSQLWPFGTLGWASDDTSELDSCYPTQVLSTARDIMGLWVARMIMSSLYCTDEIPFEDVIIHPTVMGSDGKPMSKSRGNGVNPLNLMAKYGADGMRFGLLGQVTGTQAVNFDEQRIENARNFANKVRNAARFVVMNLDGYTEGEPELLDISDKWIFSRLATLVSSVDKCYENYDFAEMTKLLYQFFWNEFCDWYIEFSKSRLKSDNDASDRAACQRNLVFVLEVACKLLHPIMPFVTEEIYASLHADKDDADMMIAKSWPEASSLEKYIDEKSVSAIEMVIDIISSARSCRARYGLSPKTELSVLVVASREEADVLEQSRSLIESLANLENLEIQSGKTRDFASSVTITNKLEIYVSLEGLVDIEAEKSRLKKKLEDCKKDCMKLEKKLSNEGYLAKASKEVIEKDRSKYQEAAEAAKRLEEEIKLLS